MLLKIINKCITFENRIKPILYIIYCYKNMRYYIELTL